MTSPWPPAWTARSMPVRAFSAANLAVVLGHLLLAELANQAMAPNPPTREPDDCH